MQLSLCHDCMSSELKEALVDRRIDLLRVGTVPFRSIPFRILVATVKGEGAYFRRGRISGTLR